MPIFWEKRKLVLERKGRHFWKCPSPFGVVCVKVYPEGEKERASQAFLGASLLLHSGLPTPLPHFVGSLPCGRSFFVAQWLEDVMPWTRRLASLSCKEQSDFVENCFSLVGELHKKGLYHRDLSHWNLVVSKEKLYFLDPEEVSSFPFPSLRFRLKNLGQLFAPLHELGGLFLAKKGFEAYRRRCPISKGLFWLAWFLGWERYCRIRRRFYQTTGKRYSFLL